MAKEIKIAKIEVFQVDLPYSGGVYHLSRGREYKSCDATIVRITTACGIEGYGKSTPFGFTYVAAHALDVSKYFIIDANEGYTIEPLYTAFGSFLRISTSTDVPIIFDELAIDAPSVIQAISDDVVEGIGLKLSKLGGLTKCRRIRDVCIAVGYTSSVQKTAASDIAFAAIVAMRRTVPERNLRCVLESREIVALKTADGDFEVKSGRVMVPAAPGLGITVRTEVLGNPVATYQ